MDIKRKILFIICASLLAAALPWAARAEVTVAVPMVDLPADELPHPDVDVEWWYYSGHLTDTEGRGYGVMASFFVTKLGNFPRNHFLIYSLSEKDAGKFHSGSLIQKTMVDMMKMVVENPPPGLREMVRPEFFDLENELQYHEIMKDKPIVKDDELAIKYGDNVFRRTKGIGRDFTNWEYRTLIKGGDFGYALTMRPTRGPMFVNGIGNVGMSEDEDLFYYSITRMETTGTVTVDGEEREVTGTIWYDHQFGALGGPENPVGWDWFCLQLENGTDLNLSAMRKLRTGERFNRLGTVQRESGRVSVVRDLTIEPLGFWTSPDTGITYPSGWKLALPSLNASFTVKPDFKAQEMRSFGPYQAIWEGPCTVTGTIEGEEVSGNAYTELVGYAYTPVE